MKSDQKTKMRLDLAERLLESAEHASEAEMRNSLSRMYYAVYHLATALAGTMAHGEFPDALDRLGLNLGRDFKRLEQLRNRADYNPDFVVTEFRDFKNFQAEFPNLMAESRRLYESLLGLVKHDIDARRA